MLLICVELNKIPLVHHKLKQLYKCLPVGGGGGGGGLIAVAYTADYIMYKLYTKMASLFLVCGL